KRLLLLLTLLPAPIAAQDVTLTAVSTNAASNMLCAPWTCTPGRVTAQPGTPLQLMVVGDPSANPVLLLVSATPALCVPIPGVHRSLIVRADAVLLPLSLNWFRVYHVCASWVGSARVQ